MSEQSELRATQRLTSEIAALRPEVNGLVDTLTTVVKSLSEANYPRAVDYYCDLLGLTAYREALVKCRILLDNNLVFIETLGVLSLTRYVFELLVWFRTLDQDPNQAIELYVQVVEEQKKHLAEYERKMLDEATFFQEHDKKDGIDADLVARGAKGDGRLNPVEILGSVDIHLRARTIATR